METSVWFPEDQQYLVQGMQAMLAINIPDRENNKLEEIEQDPALTAQLM